MIECNRCGFKISKAESITVQPPECPTCGYVIQPGSRAAKTGSHLIKNYFYDIWRIMTQPAVFFKHMPIHGGMSRPLGFALVTHWLGSAIAYLWSLIFGGSLIQLFRRIFEAANQNHDFDKPTNPFANWFLGTGQIVVDPFLTLFKIGFAASFVFIGARILVAPRRDGHPDEINFESAVKIVCFGMTPAIFSTIPVFGSALAYLGTLIVTVIGAREVYRIDSARAVIVALFPKFIFVGIIGMGLLFFTVAIFHFFSMFF